MNYDEFFKEAEKKKISMRFNNPDTDVMYKLSNEALFHLPLLAMTVLLLSKSKRKPKSDELGQLVGECFKRTFAGFKSSSQHLDWSANLRMMTVRALTFLETADLVIVDKNHSKIIATGKGRQVIEKAKNKDTRLSLTLQLIERNYHDIRIEQQIAMEQI